MVDLRPPGRDRGVAVSQSLGVGWAFLLILGILGMHAFAQHCSTPAVGSGGTAMASQTSSGPALAPDASATAHAMTDHPVGTVLTDSGSGTTQTDGSMMMLCAVMLLFAGAALFVLLGFRRGWPRGWSVRPVLSSLTQRVLAPLGTGPPYVVAFAVVRC